jgi:hypothetical protein
MSTPTIDWPNVEATIVRHVDPDEVADSASDRGPPSEGGGGRVVERWSSMSGWADMLNPS